MVARSDALAGAPKVSLLIGLPPQLFGAWKRPARASIPASCVAIVAVCSQCRGRGYVAGVACVCREAV